MRFFLHGIGGVYNYGCEAIVRCTVEILRKIWPDCEIIYMSKRPSEDRKILNGCFLSVLDNRPPARLSPKRIFKGILRRAGLPHTWIILDKIPKFSSGDCMISIGGDIFTLGPGPYSRKVEFDKLTFVRKVIQRGCPFVLWGASVGPFESWPEAVPVFSKHLKEMTLITVREPETRKYLASLGITDNVVEVADPAFIFLAECIEKDFPFDKNGQLVLGVNLSPLSVRHKQGADKTEEVIIRQTEFLRKIIDVLSVKILLIPHVVAPHNPSDDDFSYLKRIFNELKKTNDKSVALLPPNLGAKRTKGVISKCDALLAARMHCGIAGVSSGTPTIFIAYSQKAWGMSKYVYGNQKWCVDLGDLVKEETLIKIKELFRQRIQIQNQLLKSIDRFRKEALLAGNALKENLYKGNKNNQSKNFDEGLKSK